MENKTRRGSSSKSNPWIECESTSRPGMKYLFNTSTRERKWLLNSLSKEKLDGLIASKTFVSPAMERLKRFQMELQKPDKKIDTKYKSPKTPSTKKTIATGIRNSHSVVIPKPIAKSRNAPETKKPNLDIAFTTPKERLKLLQNKTVSDNLKNEKPKINISTESRNCKESTEVQKQIVNKYQRASKLVEIKNKLPEVIKPIRVSPRAKKLISEKLPNVKDNKTETISRLKSGLHRTAHQTCPLSIQKQKDLKLNEAKLLETKFLSEKPGLRFTANTRLEAFRKSLKTDSRATEQRDLSTQKCVNKNQEEDEPMDWEPSEETNVIWPSLNSPILNRSALDDVTDMEVDENLMLNAAEELQEIKNVEEKWLRRFTYVVLDTNIFINHLSFIQQLKTNNFNHGTDIVLYIPYRVLQELDKLKLRDNIKKSVTCAIRFLNKIFEEKSNLIQAQSAIEELNHLIDIKSGDDSILNCCLQVKQQIPNVILLSEDVNLRNKAICTNIRTSTTADLLKKELSFPNYKALP